MTNKSEETKTYEELEKEIEQIEAKIKLLPITNHLAVLEDKARLCTRQFEILKIDKAETDMETERINKEITKGRQALEEVIRRQKVTSERMKRLIEKIDEGDRQCRELIPSDPK